MRDDRPDPNYHDRMTEGEPSAADAAARAFALVPLVRERPGMDEPEPRRYTAHLIRRAEQHHLAAWKRAAPDSTNVQFAALSAIRHYPGMSQRELGDALDLDRSTIADLVHRLERNEWIVRTPSAVDRRVIELDLTVEGRRELAALRPAAIEVERILFGTLGDEELAELRRLLKKVLESQE